MFNTMAYYVYKINNLPGSPVKNLEYLEEFESFKDAKNFAKNKRVEQGKDDPSIYKVIFAANQLAAEEMLLEKREAPIVREWEK